MSHETSPITIRAARTDDELALIRLAALDSSVPLVGPILVAEVGGELRAAFSVGDRTAIADPFHRTAAIVEMLSTYADAKTSAEPSRRRPQLRLAHA